VECYSNENWLIRVNHLTSIRSENEVRNLLLRLGNVSLSDQEDQRFMRWGDQRKFSVKACYQAMNFGRTICQGNSEIWNSLAPKKCNFFAYG
jgi:hypothetical protein